MGTISMFLVIFVAHSHRGPLSPNHLAKFKWPRVHCTLNRVAGNGDVKYVANPFFFQTQYQCLPVYTLSIHCSGSSVAIHWITYS